MGATGLPAWQSSQPGQVGNQAALTVESVPGSRLVTLLLASCWQSMTYNGMGRAIGGFVSLFVSLSLRLAHVKTYRTLRTQRSFLLASHHPHAPATSVWQSCSHYSKPSHLFCRHLIESDTVGYHTRLGAYLIGTPLVCANVANYDGFAFEVCPLTFLATL